MKRVTFLVPRNRTEELASLLQKLRLVHLEDVAPHLGNQESLGRSQCSTEFIESKLKQPELVESVFDEFAPVKRGFFESLVSVPMRVSETERRRVVSEFDVEALSEECRRISQNHRELQREIGQAEAEIATLEFFVRLGLEPVEMRSLRRVRVWAGSLSAHRWLELQADPWVTEHLALHELRRDNRMVHLCVVTLRSEAEEAAVVLRRHEFSERPVPAIEVRAAQTIAELKEKARWLRAESEAHRERVVRLSAQRRQVAIVAAYWQAELAKMQALNNGAASKRVAILGGYVRAADAPALRAAVARGVPGASVLLEDPTASEQVPVSIRLGPVVRAMSFLVRMFGLPDYFSFDPTPYLSFSFLLFFGFCFGDAIYGLMLCAIAGHLAWKARRYEGLRNLCMLFLYGGISTIVIGVLTGSWAADLWRPEYLGENNVLLRIKERTTLVDPLDRPMLMLLVALALGVINQFYAIVLKGYGMLRRGNVAGAVLDAGLWLLMLPGFLIVASKLFFEAPEWLFRTGLVLLVVAGVSLILSQGRRETTLPAKIITGVVSLYGILGSYGCVSFTGDMLSYSRLLALGLTTSIVGMAFNRMAELVVGIPYVGMILFVAMLVAGHVFNFAMSILSAFVHSARLIFLEFFGRFYEASGVRFRPLSFDTERVLVTKP